MTRPGTWEHLQSIGELAIARHQTLLDDAIGNGYTEQGSHLVLIGVYNPQVSSGFSPIIERTSDDEPPQAYRRQAYHEASMLARIGGSTYPAYNRLSTQLLQPDDPQEWRGGAFVEPFLAVVVGCTKPGRNQYLGACIASYAAMLYLDEVADSSEM